MERLVFGLFHPKDAFGRDRAADSVHSYRLQNQIVKLDLKTWCSLAAGELRLFPSSQCSTHLLVAGNRVGERREFRLRAARRKQP